VDGDDRSAARERLLATAVHFLLIALLLSSTANRPRWRDLDEEQK
jgi:CelD/BcsL family acetyltransferase involved in cellulose biosynthesis